MESPVGVADASISDHAPATSTLPSNPPPENSIVNISAEMIITQPTSEIISYSDRSNGLNEVGGGAGGVGSSSTSDGSPIHHGQRIMEESGKLVLPGSVPEIVLTVTSGSNEVESETNVVEAASPQPRPPTLSVKKSPNRYSRMKNELSNNYAPSKYSQAKKSDMTLPPSNTTRTPSKVVSSSSSSFASSSLQPANGQPCMIHTPTLDELQSMTFSEFVRTKVLPAAMASSSSGAVNGDSDTACDTEDEEEEDDDLNHTRSDRNSCTTNASSPIRRTGTAPRRNPSTTPTTRRRTASTTRTTTIATRTRTQRGGDNTALLSSSAEPMVLREGIAKIRLPCGFFTTAPYGRDTTGRGPIWERGTLLGDKVFQYPILQNIRGMTGVYEYTHTELPTTTLAEFRDRADQYRLHQMGSALLEFKKEDDASNNSNTKKNNNNNEMDDKRAELDQSNENDRISTNNNPKSNNNSDSNDETVELTPEQVAQLERQFWKRLSPTMPPPVYGADEPGTLFGDDPASGWSLAQLDSCLHVLSDIPGVTSPYLYAGMWASVFCAHTEDMNLLSINYLHAGQPKIWYAVAEQDAARFVSLAEHHFIHQLQKCKEFLRHKRCLLSPLILQQAGIRYQTAIQYPGDAIITFPGGYHFGFNAGFNIAEATNFGVLEWLPFDRKAKICLCRPDSVRIDMNRLTYLLQRYQVDVKRNKRLTWKEWRKRYERKEGITTESKSEIIETEDEIIEVISYAPKKRQRKTKTEIPLSEQERKNEFWIEVTLPSQLRKTNPSMKKGSKQSKKTDVKPWYLAKPVGRKRLEVNTKILCLVPVTSSTSASMQVTVSTSDVDDDGMLFLNDHQVEELCFTGTIIRIEDKHALIHFDGQSKSSDIWMPLSSTKIFLNGGVWDEAKHAIHNNHKSAVVVLAADPALGKSSVTTTSIDGTTNAPMKVGATSVTATPVLHYWKEMDTNVLPL